MLFSSAGYRPEGIKTVIKKKKTNKNYLTLPFTKI